MRTPPPNEITQFLLRRSRGDQSALDQLMPAVYDELYKLTKTTFIQRSNTAGGLAPSSGCSSQADIGREAFVPYKADYFFYRDASVK